MLQLTPTIKVCVNQQYKGNVSFVFGFDNETDKTSCSFIISDPFGILGMDVQSVTRFVDDKPELSVGRFYALKKVLDNTPETFGFEFSSLEKAIIYEALCNWEESTKEPEIKEHKYEKLIRPEILARNLRATADIIEGGLVMGEGFVLAVQKANKKDNLLEISGSIFAPVTMAEDAVCSRCNGDEELETGQFESETGYPITVKCPSCCDVPF